MIEKKEFCPIRDIISRFGDKWSILVLLNLHCQKVLRFNVLNKCIPDVSQKMLTVTLRKLEADKLIIRQVYSEVPPKVEYQLSDIGMTLIPHIQGLVAWAKEHKDECFNRSV